MGNCFELIISGRFLCSQRPTGTHRSSLGIARSLVAAGLVDKIVCPRVPDLSVLDALDITPFIIVGGGWLANDHLWEQFYLPLKFKGRCLIYTMGSGPAFIGCRRSVMVVHDLNYILVKDAFGKAFRILYSIVSSVAARRVGKILAISEYTRDRLVELLNVRSSKIHVFYQGTGLSKSKEGNVAKKIGSILGTNYFLCVGSLQPHKNLNTVLKAYRSLSDKLKADGVSLDLKLVIVGSPQKNFKAINFEKQSDGVMYTGYITDYEVRLLYRNAIGFVYPSLEEGFGMPLIEAFEEQCAVVTSNCSCLPEIAGDAALMIDPLCHTELEEAMRTLLFDESLRARFKMRGKVRASKFCWKDTERQLARILT